MEQIKHGAATGPGGPSGNCLTAADRVRLARSPQRPGAEEYIRTLFEEFFPMAGDRCGGEDEAVLGGVALYHGMPVTVIAQRKGRDLKERTRYRFGMPNPEGYRKAERLMKQAEKFGRPVITFVDTPGAYPGREAEERGQGEAIARCLSTMCRLTVPTASVFIGEGGSGGALAIGVTDILIMLENSIFSILSPEGFASILWKDAGRWEEAAEVMKLTAENLKELAIADVVVPEPVDWTDGAAKAALYRRLDQAISEGLEPLFNLKGTVIADRRYEKLRRIGAAGENTLFSGRKIAGMDKASGRDSGAGDERK